MDKADQIQRVKDCFWIIAEKGVEVHSGQVFTTEGWVDKNLKTITVRILCSDIQNPKVAHDGYVMEEFRVSNVGATNFNIEFHFYDTLIKVYVYPEGNPQSKTEMKVAL